MSNLMLVIGYVVQITTALAAVIAAVSTLLNKGALKELKVSIDGRLENLLELSTAKGELVGRAAERADAATELAAASDRAQRPTVVPPT